MDSSYREIAEALSVYFDGFYTGDTGTLQGIFHPNCHLFSADGGGLADDDMPAVYARVEARPPPASQRQTRQDRIVSIDLSSPNSALAKVEIAIGEKLYTDFLTLLRLDGRWQIISKTYTSVPIALETEAAVAAE